MYDPILILIEILFQSTGGTDTTSLISGTSSVGGFTDSALVLKEKERTVLHKDRKIFGVEYDRDAVSGVDPTMLQREDEFFSLKSMVITINVCVISK